MPEDPQAACSHDTLHAVEGLYAFYRCPACGSFFNLQLLNIIRHEPQDLKAMAHWFTKALENAGDGDSTHGVPRHTGD